MRSIVYKIMKHTQQNRLLLWCDLETTGLDGQIIEVALRLTDHTLTQVGYPYHSYVKPTEPFEVDLVVAQMHAVNGLWASLTNARPRLVVEDEMIVWLETTLGQIRKDYVVTERPTLAGNTIKFDKQKFEEQMPDFDRKLHYRLFDVSTLIAAYRMWVGDMPKGLEKHRAMDDVLESIDTAGKFMVAYCAGTQAFADIFESKPEPVALPDPA